jgi:selenocysteine lyase/cysteine desulfurase
MITSSLRGEFSLPPEKVYLNCAFMAPVSKKVEEAGVTAVRKARDPSVFSSSDFFDTTNLVRAEFARLIQAPDPEQISIGPAASYGITGAARNIPFSKGDEIVVLHEQFPSHYYPWRRRAEETQAEIVTVLPSENESWDDAILNAIGPHTKSVCLPVVHWTDGTLFDINVIAARVRDVDAYLVIDGTQSVGALPFNVGRVQPDALICAGYKWLTGPYGCAVTYWSPRLSGGIPVEENWISRKGSEDFSRLVSYEDDYQPGALRHDSGGRSNFVIMAMLRAALEQVNEWRPEYIQQHCAQISEACIDRLHQAGFFVPGNEARANHLFGIRVPDRYDYRVLAEYLRINKISVSVRGSSIRVAPNVYNDESDLNKLSAAILAFTGQQAR